MQRSDAAWWRRWTALAVVSAAGMWACGSSNQASATGDTKPLPALADLDAVAPVTQGVSVTSHYWGGDLTFVDAVYVAKRDVNGTAQVTLYLGQNPNLCAHLTAHEGDGQSPLSIYLNFWPTDPNGTVPPGYYSPTRTRGSNRADAMGGVYAVIYSYGDPSPQGTATNPIIAEGAARIVSGDVNNQGPLSFTMNLADDYNDKLVGAVVATYCGGLL